MEMHLERQGLAMQLVSDSRRTILVTGASGIVGYGILKSLKESNCFLIGSTVYEVSPANCSVSYTHLTLPTILLV